ncbi:MAG TPA: adenylate/guanylate cyclase domain-containing protein [Kofleriaceae bacterium]
MSQRQQPTKGTEIAALEAKQNELSVRADGALLGEKRAAIARLVMISLFGLVSVLRGGVHDWYQSAVGAAYAAWSLLVLVALFRIKVVRPERARWFPVLLTTIDFAATTTLGMLDIWFTGEFNAGQHAISTAILMMFSIARISVWQVAYSLACALVSFLLMSWYGSTFVSHATVFITAGYIVLGLMLALTNRAIGQMFQDLRRRDNLTRFLPRQVAERVMKDGPRALAPVQREITVLFSDIRGFTGMSEGLEPTEVLTMLDDYFGRMSQIVKGHDGVVGKFMGDGLLAYWGVPDTLDDHAVRAVRAARDMRRAVRELNDHRATTGLAPIRIGIGIHTGIVAAGMLGGTLQSEYTVIGDAVNVASRVEGLTKDYKVDVLISETTWAQLAEPRRGERLGSAEIRGRKEPVVLYTIDGSAATVEVSAKPGI